VPAAAPDMTAALRTSAPTVAAALANIAPANLPASAPASTGYGNDPLGEFGSISAANAAAGAAARISQSASQLSQITGNDRAAAVINTVVRRGPR